MAQDLIVFGTKYRDLDECVETYVTWYIANEARVTSLDSAVRFLRLALNGRVYILHLLREELLALRRSHSDSNQLDAALDQFTIWYAANSETITDPLKFVEFAKKATDDTLHLLFLMRDEIRRAERLTNVQDSTLALPLIYR